MFHYLQAEYQDIVGVESPHHMNAYLNGYADLTSTKEDIKNWDKDSFIVHFFQLSSQDRVNLFKQILKKVICKRKNNLLADKNINHINENIITVIYDIYSVINNPKDTIDNVTKINELSPPKVNINLCPFSVSIFSSSPSQANCPHPR